jgi:hypothetical protein
MLDDLCYSKEKTFNLDQRNRMDSNLLGIALL